MGKRKGESPGVRKQKRKEETTPNPSPVTHSKVTLDTGLTDKSCKTAAAHPYASPIESRNDSSICFVLVFPTRVPFMRLGSLEG